MTAITKWIILVVLILGNVAVFSWIFLNTESAVPTSLGNISRYITLPKPKSLATNSQPLIVTKSDFRIQNPVESGKNTYIFAGTLVSIDPEKALIFIKSDSDKIYSFKIDNYLYKDTDQWFKIYTVPNVETLEKGVAIGLSGTPPPKFDNVLTNAINISLTANRLPKDVNSVLVRWNDTRNTKQIAADYQISPSTPLNIDSPENIVLAEIKQ